MPDKYITYGVAKSNYDRCNVMKTEMKIISGAHQIRECGILNGDLLKDCDGEWVPKFAHYNDIRIKYLCTIEFNGEYVHYFLQKEKYSKLPMFEILKTSIDKDKQQILINELDEMLEHWCYVVLSDINKISISETDYKKLFGNTY